MPGRSRYQRQLLSLASTVLISHPKVLANSSSIFSSRGVTSLNNSSSIFSSREGTLRNSFWIQKEGKSNVLSRISNYISLSSWKGAGEWKRGTAALKGIEMPQCHRTAFSKQPGFTGGGKTVETLKYSAHLKIIIFQNCLVYSVSPKTRFRQSRAKDLYLFCPSAFFSANRLRYSFEFLACFFASEASSMRSAMACLNSFLMVLARTSARTISLTQGRLVFSWIRWRYRTLMPISCMVVLMEQLSTKSTSRLLSLSTSRGIQQFQISLLASFTLLSSTRLNYSAAEETMKAWLSSWQLYSLQQSLQKATISGLRRARALRLLFWKLQSMGKTMPGLMRQQKLGRMIWSCVLSFLKLYSKTLRVFPRGASTFLLASTSKGSLLTFITSSMTQSASLSLPMSCRSPSEARRLQTSVFSSSEKGMSHMTSSFTPLYSMKVMSGRRTLQPRTSRSVNRMSLMLQFTMNYWFISFPPVFSHSPLQCRQPLNSRVPSPNPHTYSSMQFSAMRLAEPLKNSISLRRASSRSIFSGRAARGSSLMICSQYLQYSLQKAEMAKDSCTSWFLALTISAISFSFFLRCRMRSSSAISALVLSRFLVFWMVSTYSSMFCSCLSSLGLLLGVAVVGISLASSLSSLGESGTILARMRLRSRSSSRLDSMNSLTSNGNSKSHFSSFYSAPLAYSYSQPAALAWSLALTSIFFSGKTISRKVFLILLRGRKLTSCMKSRRTAALKCFRLRELGSCSTNPGCRLQYQRKASWTWMMRSLEVHPSLLSFLQALGLLRHSSDISSMIQSGKVRLSFRMLSLLLYRKPTLAHLFNIANYAFSCAVGGVCGGDDNSMLGGEQLQLDKEQVLKQCFELVRVLGEGSFGKVYLIRNRQTRKEYALKRYNRHHIEKRGKYRMLVRSIFILQALHHRAVIQFVNYILSPDDATIYLLFEPCKRGSLDRIRRVIDKRPQVRTRVIKYILFELAEVLAYLKGRSVAHRDLKPSNITFDSKGQLKLIDFDEAVCFDAKFSSLSQSKMLSDFGINVGEVMAMFSSQKSRASSYVGTQIYMSPEMIHSTVCDEKGDLWAYGCIFYELFLGDYLHIEFDSVEKFEEQLAHRVEALAQKVDKSAIDLFKAIANYSPRERIQIEEVTKHPFFDEIRPSAAMEECRVALVSILRGNHGIVAKTSLDICEVEVIGMRIGKETFQLLKTVILLRKGSKYEFSHIYGGPQYLKVQPCQRPDKFYIHYEKIRKMELKDEHIHIHMAPQGTHQQIITFKHLYPDMLNQLFALLKAIYDD